MMRRTPGIVVAVNSDRRICVVRAEEDRHAVVGHRSDSILHLGDLLVGNFSATGHGKLHNLTKGESLWVHVHIVDMSFAEASSFAS